MESRRHGARGVPPPGAALDRMAADDDRISSTTKTTCGALPMNLIARSTAALALGLCLSLLPAPARAQLPNAPPPVEEESKGDPVVAYVATAFLAFLALFVVCKSARR